MSAHEQELTDVREGSASAPESSFADALQVGADQRTTAASELSDQRLVDLERRLADVERGLAAMQEQTCTGSS